MPTTQLAWVKAPLTVAEQGPLVRAGSPTEGSTFLPRRVAPVVPVHPRKQARH